MVFKNVFISLERTRSSRKDFCAGERLLQPGCTREQHSAAHGHHGFCLMGTTHLKDKDIKPAGCEGSPSSSWLLLGSLQYLTFFISRNEPERFLAGEGQQRERMSGLSVTYGLLEERDTQCNSYQYLHVYFKLDKS